MPPNLGELTAAVPELDAPQEVRLLSMERPLTVLRVSLHHPTPGSATFAYVPPQLEHDASPLLVGRGPDAHLRLQLPRLSRQHLSLEPYLEKGGTRLAFSLKALSRKGSVWVNGLTLRFLEQVTLGAVNRVAFSGVQMVVRIEGGTSLEAFVCCFHLSPSPLIYRLRAEETDERESVPQEQPPPGSGHGAPDHLGFLHSPLQPSPGGVPEIPLQREPLDGSLS
ncbi:TRAF-interacting protein with FHA domain-containing protein B [Bos taurus]|uniref:TIFA inhibitor n=2 Tax=Bos TaxID=9903 RepID=F1MZP5_BOVIN|nr:TRAF-interacting protein with FHA domain-containing protein B [Bos taurus]